MRALFIVALLPASALAIGSSSSLHAPQLGCRRHSAKCKR